MKYPDREQLCELADGTGVQLLSLVPWPDDRPVSAFPPKFPADE